MEIQGKLDTSLYNVNKHCKVVFNNPGQHYYNIIILITKLK